jgi:predicted short-subunit dehydrogenase-like oxidoreductase (DUF2520 family)
MCNRISPARFVQKRYSNTGGITQELNANGRSVAIIGAGRVGRVMGRRLRDAGWNVRAVVARSEESARRAVRYIGEGRPYGKLTRLMMDARVVLIAVPDDAIARVAHTLSHIGGEEWRAKVALHTSGALDSGVLAVLRERGAATGSLHPMQTFSGRTLPTLDGVMMTMEGAPPALRAARQIVRSLGGSPLLIRREDKLAYHAAGVFAAAHALTMIEAGTQILCNVGFSRRQAMLALLKLSRQVLSNLEKFGPAVAWTGPLARGDYGTLAGHAVALRAYAREFGEAYATAHLLGARLLAQDPDAVLAKLKRALGPKPKKVRAS